MQKLERITEETLKHIKDNNLYVSLKTGEVTHEPLKRKGPYNEVLLKDAYDLYVNGKFYPYDWVENFNILNPVSLLTAFKKRGWKTLSRKETSALYEGEILARREQTNIRKLGVRNPMQSEEVLENYTSAFSRPEVQAKRRETLMRRDGVDNPMKLEKYKKKQEATMLRRHKVRHNWCKGPLRDEQIQTMQDLYQCSYTFESPELLAKARETTNEFYGKDDIKRRIFRAKGIEWMLDAELQIRDKLQTGLVSKEEIILEIYETFPYYKALNLLKELGLKARREYSQETKLRLWLESQGVKYQHNVYKGSGLFSETGRPRQLDFKLLDYPIAIEVNGLYNHSVDGRKEDFEVNYHLEKFIGCFYNNTMLLSFTDYEIDNCFDFVKAVVEFHLGLMERTEVFEEFEKIKDSIDMSSGEFACSCNYGMYGKIEEYDIAKIEIRPRMVNGYTYYDSGLLNGRTK